MNQQQSSDQALSADGQWIVPQMSYIEPDRRACAFCGQPIPRRYWLVDSSEAEPSRTFCNPDHAERYQSYWLPTHGKRATRNNESLAIDRG